MLQSPETKAIRLAAEVVSKTPESFMLGAAVAEACKVLEHRISTLYGTGDIETAQDVEAVLAALRED